ncbi:hypothetical protein XFLAVUS301_48790 [Xanthobacter flavus]|uniref:Uncharacterized protein n=1 Tax=Xanthobacter flavus TaxID=281 RepID=A0A9W6CT09_XANFL|nr:hypothetical protein XFLAVUS301_48790 [Xanthobacter flavus]
MVGVGDLGHLKRLALGLVREEDRGLEAILALLGQHGAQAARAREPGGFGGSQVRIGSIMTRSSEEKTQRPRCDAFYN